MTQELELSRQEPVAAPSITASRSDGWEFVYALPNLFIRSEDHSPDEGHWASGIDLDSDHLALVGGEHARVKHLRQTNRSVEQILSAFHDEFGQSYDPAVILLREDSPPSLKTKLEAINDFRNAVALSFLLMGRAAVARGGGSLDPTWSDTFDFHPAQIGQRGNVILYTPAHFSLLGDGALRFAPSPYVPIFRDRLIRDTYLYRCFGRQWRRRYIVPAKDDRYGRTLFRSLEVAYQACSVGVKTLGSVHEYGAQVALWVSAVEILAWPNKRRANLENVLNLLEPLEAVHERGRTKEIDRKKYRVRVAGESRSATVLQRGYAALYKARNRFLHGEPVSYMTLLPRVTTTPIALPRMAALIYRAALVGYLNKRYRKELRTNSDLRNRAVELFDDSGYERGIKSLIDPNAA